MTRRRRLLFVTLVAVLGLVVVGSQQGNRVAGTLGGREVIGISRHVMAAARYSADEAVATLTLGSRSATVTADAVKLEDDQVLPIPASCKRIEIRDTSDGLRVSFDGAVAPR